MKYFNKFRLHFFISSLLLIFIFYPILTTQIIEHRNISYFNTKAGQLEFTKIVTELIDAEGKIKYPLVAGGKVYPHKLDLTSNAYLRSMENKYGRFTFYQKVNGVSFFHIGESARFYIVLPVPAVNSWSLMLSVKPQYQWASYAYRYDPDDRIRKLIWFFLGEP
jgi:hypothetical protein